MTERRERSTEQATPTTLSSAARGGWVGPRARRPRLDLAIWGAAIIAGSLIGGTLALRAEPSSAPAAPAPTPPSLPSPPVQTASSSAAPSAPKGDPRVAAVAQIKDALIRFVAWSHDHPGVRCPDAAALGAAIDPWGHPLRITCTDQPADQIAGVVSAGPDGIAGTRDDVESWTLGADVVDLVRGPRWSASHTSRRTTSHAGKPAPAATTPPAAPPGATTRPPASPAAGSNDNDGDGIPDRR
ncbi:MAG TPA: hypothetical protein VIX73_08290 [Kofleriaceae bacterium]|jgi:hypothetical protein